MRSPRFSINSNQRLTQNSPSLHTIHATIAIYIANSKIFVRIKNSVSLSVILTQNTK